MENHELKIMELNQHLLPDANKANEPFDIIGRLVPSLNSSQWTWHEELLEQPYPKTYPNSDDYSDYISSPNRKVFLAYASGICVGHIALRTDWNRYGFVEDIQISRATRGQGVGTALIQKAKEWAKHLNLCGLALETQDNNLLACRFYAKCGFVIGGVNTMFYGNLPKPQCDEAAIFWYLKF